MQYQATDDGLKKKVDCSICYSLDYCNFCGGLCEIVLIIILRVRTKIRRRLSNNAGTIMIFRVRSRV